MKVKVKAFRETWIREKKDTKLEYGEVREEKKNKIILKAIEKCRERCAKLSFAKIKPKRKGGSVGFALGQGLCFNLPCLFKNQNRLSELY